MIKGSYRQIERDGAGGLELLDSLGARESLELGTVARLDLVLMDWISRELGPFPPASDPLGLHLTWRSEHGALALQSARHGEILVPKGRALIWSQKTRETLQAACGALTWSDYTKRE